MNGKRVFYRTFIGGIAVNLLLLGGGVSFHLFFIKPTYENFARQNQTIAELEQRQTSLGTLSNEVRQRSTDIARLQEAFLNSQDVISFVTLLETMADRSGVALIIKSANVETEANLKKLSEFEMSLAGPAANILQFVTLAENMPYFTDISSLTITSQGGQPQAQVRLHVLTL